MAFFTEEYLNKRRKEILNSVEKVQYQINNSSWHDGTINDKTIDGSNVIIFMDAPSSGQADTITGVRVYDNYGHLAGQQTISLKRNSISSALIRFTFSLEEE